MLQCVFSYNLKDTFAFQMKHLKRPVIRRIFQLSHPTSMLKVFHAYHPACTPTTQPASQLVPLMLGPLKDTSGLLGEKILELQSNDYLSLAVCSETFHWYKHKKKLLQEYAKLRKC